LNSIQKKGKGEFICGSGFRLRFVRREVKTDIKKAQKTASVRGGIPER